MLDPGYFTSSDLANVGFKRVGKNVLVARDAIFVGFQNIELGNNIRIDSNVTLAVATGFLRVSDYVHIGGATHINCTGGVNIGKYVAISQGVKIYSASDDYSGKFMTNPTVPALFRMDDVGEINIGDHSIIGSGSVILPGVSLSVGTAVGALSLVKTNTEEFSIYAGSPARKVGVRSRNVEELAKKLPTIG